MNKKIIFPFLICLVLLLTLFKIQPAYAYQINWSTASLSLARYQLASTGVGDKVIFAGGHSGFNSQSSSVDIYNNTTGTWSTASLSQPRGQLAATTVGTKAIFAGGLAGGFSAFKSNRVDIYDDSNGTWSTASLSMGRDFLVATSVGDKALFAGGVGGISNISTSVVDIYNNSTNTWSTTNLSEIRGDFAATSVGNKAFFAGGSTASGHSDHVDIYDNSTGTWSIATLSQPRYGLSATTVGTKAIFAGGRNNNGLSSVVDIYDASTDTWSTSTLSQPRYRLAATTVGSRAIFAGGDGGSDVLDIYDDATGTWSSTTVYPRYYHTATSVGNKAFFAGGTFPQSRVDIAEVDENSLPSAGAGTDQTANEGQQVTFDGSGSSDPDGNEDIVSYEWDFGDGTSASGQIVNHTYTDNGVYTATLTVTDSEGEFDSDTATITVTNISPTASFSISQATILQGESSTLSFSNQFDPGSADTLTGFSYSYDCTSDGIFELANSVSTSFSCTYPNSGNFTAKGRIKDKDGSYSDYLTPVTVQTPAQAVNDVVDLVETYNLQQGIQNNLDAKLESAQNALNDINQNNDQAAINSLEAFINAVEAQRGNQITSGQADALTAEAQAIIASLNN